MSDYADLVAELRARSFDCDTTRDEKRRAADAIEALEHYVDRLIHGQQLMAETSSRWEAERDAALAKLAAVEELCDFADRHEYGRSMIPDIRAALRGEP